MTFSWFQVIVWILVGLIAGSIVGLLVKRDRKGFGLTSNLLIGLAGALWSEASCSACSACSPRSISTQSRCATCFRRSSER